VGPTRAAREACACIVLLVEKLQWHQSEKDLVLKMFAYKDFQTSSHHSSNNKDHGHLRPVNHVRAFNEPKATKGEKPKDTTT